MIDPKSAVKLIQDKASYLKYNYELIDVFEGNLAPYILKDLKDQMNIQSYTQASYRCAPINVTPKIIDKLTTIYQGSVVREVIDGTPGDEELFAWYQEKMAPNGPLHCMNELFNLCKAGLIQPYVHEGIPQLRVILNDRFVLHSSDIVMPWRPTDVIICAGKKTSVDGVGYYDGQGSYVKDLYMVYSEDSFYIVDSDGKIDYAEMQKYGFIDSLNPVAPHLPFVYCNDSKYRLMPVQDTDMMTMTKIIPIMLTDLNFAAMFQAFSIIYGIDLNDENIKFNPNAFWRFKSDPMSSQKPEIGMIKPQVDYDQVLGLIQAELSMWLATKGIRPGTVGSLTADNFASGISKLIDEMDTYEARQKQVEVFTKVEAQLWDLILNVMHPYWVSQGLIENKQLWSSSDAKIKTTFAVQLPMQSRGQTVKDLAEERAAGFIDREGAIRLLNPTFTDKQVLELIAKIDAERTISVESAQGEPNPDEQSTGGAQDGDEEEAQAET